VSPQCAEVILCLLPIRVCGIGSWVCCRFVVWEHWEPPLRPPPLPSLDGPHPADVTADYYIYNTDTSIPGVGMSAQQSGGLLTQSHTNYGFMTNNPQVGGAWLGCPCAHGRACVFCLCVVYAELGGSVCWM
jgi:hypothetical protein